jgi:hypothetical protein
VLGGQRLEFRAVRVDFACIVESLVELLLHGRFADHDQRSLPSSSCSPSSLVSLRNLPPTACPVPPTIAAARIDRVKMIPTSAYTCSGPCAMPGGLLVLGHVHLVVVVLIHQRDVMDAYGIGGVEVKQRFAIGIGVRTIRIHRCVHKHWVIAAHHPAPLRSLRRAAGDSHHASKTPAPARDALAVAEASTQTSLRTGSPAGINQKG